LTAERAPLVVLIPSPFLGPAVWRPVAACLAARGVRAMTPPPPAQSVTSPADVVDRLDAVLPAQEELVVVPHSNAGLYAPEIAARRAVRGFVFVDAVLPPSQGSMPVARTGLVDLLAGKATADGLLPRWTEWWPEEDVAALFPSPEVRAAVEAEQPRLPATYLTSRVDVPAGWDDVPSTYLAFGDTYAQETDEAAARGWQVFRMAGDHLHMLQDPDTVARAITQAAPLT
jgi:pimeloyl-ACP methyl ester carboxylesterase